MYSPWPPSAPFVKFFRIALSPLLHPSSAPICLHPALLCLAALSVWLSVWLSVCCIVIAIGIKAPSGCSFGVAFGVAFGVLHRHRHRYKGSIWLLFRCGFRCGFRCAASSSPSLSSISSAAISKPSASMVVCCIVSSCNCVHSLMRIGVHFNLACTRVYI